MRLPVGIFLAMQCEGRDPLFFETLFPVSYGTKAGNFKEFGVGNVLMNGFCCFVL